MRLLLLMFVFFGGIQFVGTLFSTQLAKHRPGVVNEIDQSEGDGIITFSINHLWRSVWGYHKPWPGSHVVINHFFGCGLRNLHERKH
jgi:hypothetical protein